MPLLSHFKKQDWPSLEDAWTELIIAEGPTDEVLAVLEQATSKRQMSHCLGMVREHAEVLTGAGRAEEAAEIVGRAMMGGGSPGELGKLLWSAASTAWGNESWWEPFTELAGFGEGAPDMRAAWRAFNKLRAIDDTAAVYHPTGWGVGAIERLDVGALEVEIRFSNGRRDRFPLTTAVDIFEILPPDDLRTISVRDPEELRRRVKAQPLEILASLLTRYSGRATQQQLKMAMAQVGIDGAAFTGWWRRTRKEADADPWYEVTGSGARAQVRRLAEAADPTQALRTQLARSVTLRDARQRVREFLRGGEHPEEMRAVALESLAELAREEGSPLEERLAAWMFLREETKITPDLLLARLRLAAEQPVPASPAEPPALWALLQVIPGARDQERAIELLREVYEDEWPLHARQHLPHAAPGMVRGLVEALMEAGERDALANHYNFLLARPRLNPNLLIVLAEYAEAGRFEGEWPGPVQRLQALVQLSGRLEEMHATPHVTRARTRLTQLLTSGDPPLLHRMLDDATTADLKNVYTQTQRGVERAIERVFTSLIVERAPEIFRAEGVPFWDEPVIWTTRAGLAQKEIELKELVEVKIPENSEAIGRAAALGDLSENSEWESAMEEQRNLTARATQLQGEIERAALLEDATLPEDVVCPGARVSYRDVAQDAEHTVTILGPWDTEREGVISYLSPIAQGMLGLGVGETATVQLPSGSIELEVRHVETVEI